MLGKIYDWMDYQKYNITFMSLSFVCFWTSLKLVNAKREFEEREDALKLQLRDATLARSALLNRLPGLARDAGLPKRSQEKYDQQLKALVAEIEEDPEAAAIANTRSARTATMGETARAPTSPTSPPKPRQQAVW